MQRCSIRNGYTNECRLGRVVDDEEGWPGHLIVIIQQNFINTEVSFEKALQLVDCKLIEPQSLNEFPVKFKAKFQNTFQPFIFKVAYKNNKNVSHSLFRDFLLLFSEE